jgi:hypothetical protein
MINTTNTQNSTIDIYLVSQNLFELGSYYEEM